MKHRTVATLVVLGVLLMCGSAMAWEWTEDFYENTTRWDVVDSHGNANDQSFSYIANHDNTVEEASAIIWGNDWPEHLHVVREPSTSQVYIKWVTHQVDLFDCNASMSVSEGEFSGSSDYVRIHLEYPY